MSDEFDYVTLFRESEQLCRQAGLFEQANAMRLMADSEEEVRAGMRRCTPDCCIFDRGVFDVYGPPDEGEIPYLVTESPRLNPHLYRQVSGGRRVRL